MGVLRRRKREVYRLYSEEEFLSDPGALSDWSVSPVKRVSRERPLRRLAGIAALTGAVGTAVAAIALAGFGSRSPGRRATASATSRAAAARGTAARSTSAPMGGANRRRPRPVRTGARPHGVRDHAARFIDGYRPALRRRVIHWSETRSELRGSIADAARPERIVSAQATARAQTRSEFGFER